MLRDLFSLFPAYAGVIPSSMAYRSVSNSFPRICGGDPQLRQAFQVQKYLFPAYAGVILYDYGNNTAQIAFPRIRGGDPCGRARAAPNGYFSPHMRG